MGIFSSLHRVKCGLKPLQCCLDCMLVILSIKNQIYTTIKCPKEVKESQFFLYLLHVPKKVALDKSTHFYKDMFLLYDVSLPVGCHDFRRTAPFNNCITLLLRPSRPPCSSSFSCLMLLLKVHVKENLLPEKAAGIQTDYKHLCSCL